MGRPADDLTGQRFGRLLVLRRAGTYRNHFATWECRCDCGNIKVAVGSEMKVGHTRSCWCLSKETAATLSRTHGKYGSRAYNAWRRIVQRCTNPKCHAYRNYGGRGITVGFASFEEFYAEVGDPAPGMTIDRINNERGYEPGNLRWVPLRVNLLNTRHNHRITHNGKTQTLTEWANETGIGKATIRQRLLRGWSPDKALSVSP